MSGFGKKKYVGERKYVEHLYMSHIGDLVSLGDPKTVDPQLRDQLSREWWLSLTRQERRACKRHGIDFSGLVSESMEVS